MTPSRRLGALSSKSFSLLFSFLGLQPVAALYQLLLVRKKFLGNERVSIFRFNVLC